MRKGGSEHGDSGARDGKRPSAPGAVKPRVRARKVGGIASQQIVGHISQWLYEGKLKPGDFLGSEDVLAERFGVSKLPVRDALRALQAVGLLDIRVGASGGIYVSAADTARFANALAVHSSLLSLSLKDMLEAQLALEGMIVDKAARAATPEQCDVLQSVLDEARAAIADPATFIGKCQEFHMTIAQISESRMAAVLLDGVLSVLFAKFLREHTPLRGEGVLAQHALLLHHLRANDAAAARSHVNAYLRTLADDLLGRGAWD